MNLEEITWKIKWTFVRFYINEVKQKEKNNSAVIHKGHFLKNPSVYRVKAFSLAANLQTGSLSKKKCPHVPPWDHRPGGHHFKAPQDKSGTQEALSWLWLRTRTLCCVPSCHSNIVQSLSPPKQHSPHAYAGISGFSISTREIKSCLALATLAQWAEHQPVD